MLPSDLSRVGELPMDAPGIEARKVGLLAGWGSFPVEVAERCVAEGHQVYVVAFKGHADPRLAQLATEIKWMGLLKIGGHMRFFDRVGVRQVAMAGKLFKEKILYHGCGWLAHLPDLTCYRILGDSFVTKRKDTRDDTLLTSVVRAYQRRGMNVLPVTSIAPQLLVEEGCLTRRAPSRSQLLDIHFGWPIARSMGGLDIGQSITVKDQNVLGVEAVEGTDALIARTGKLCPRGGFTLIKIAKPQQDMRFDVPTIGLRTVEQLAAAGGKVLAIEAERTILVDRQATIDFANRHGISIFSLRAETAAMELRRAA
ncbi:MAG: UDP-2,3-diacylglucosamine diphosphatase LpxI [Pirellulaceae bacterium]